MYTTYAIIENGSVVEYPVDPHNKHEIDPLWEGGVLDGKEYVFCHNKEPLASPEQKLVETRPAFDIASGLWYRQYNIVQEDPVVVAEKRAVAVERSLATVAACEAVAAEILSKELTDQQRQDWLTYKNDLQSAVGKDNYPWTLTLPQPPDQNSLKIEVERL